MRRNRWAGTVLLGLTANVIACLSGNACAQPAADEPLQVVIERAPFGIRPAASYDIPLKLEAAQQVDVVALGEGVVLPFRIKPGDKMASQSELLRLDPRLRQLELDRAAAALQAAKQLQQKGGVAAQIEVAQKDVELAQLRLDQLVVRMPWDGMVFRVHVAEGEYVRAGDPLVTVADPSKLVVDAPVDRAAAKVGDNITLKVEDVAVEGTLAAIMPLSERLDPLRGLFQSVASGLIEIDNTDGRLLPGQTVYSEMIPRHPVGEAPTAAIANSEDGARKVQVIRDGMIRDVPVQLLGQVGEEYIWISGRFAPEDQLILRTSEPLPDGTLVSPRQLAGQPPSTRAATPDAPRSAPKPNF